MSRVAQNSVEWYALRVKSNRENITYTSLSRKGYQAFLPQYRPRMGTQSSEKKRVPLFPGYLFCKLDIEKRLPVLMLPGILHIVGSGRTPLPLDEEEVESLRVLVNSNLSIDPIDYFSIGQKIRVKRGPLSGAVGTVTGRRHDRLVVSITLLQRSVSAEVNPEWIDGGGEPSDPGPLPHLHAEL